MKKWLILAVGLLLCANARADVILLKNGNIIEGKIIQVRDPFIRIQTNYNTPFREFLLENIANIELSDPTPASVQAVEVIHQRASNALNSKKLQDIINKKANAFIEEAIESSETLSLVGASEEVKTVVREKATALISDAVKSVETPRLNEATEEVQVIAKAKAGGLITEALKDVGASPLDNAPQGVQAAAKNAATILISEAVKDVEASRNQEVPAGPSVKAQDAANVLIKEVMKEEREQNLRAEVISESEGALPVPGARLREEWFTRIVAYRNQVIIFLAVLLALVLLVSGLQLRKAAVAEAKIKPLEQPVELRPSEVESRKSPRVPWINPILLDLGNVLPIAATIQNISLGGVYAQCNDIKLLQTGDQCRLKLGPSRENINLKFHCNAEVVHIQPTRGLGLKFLGLDEFQVRVLNRILRTA